MCGDTELVLRLQVGEVIDRLRRNNVVDVLLLLVDRRRNGVGVPGDLLDQHVGHMDGPRTGSPNWSFWANDAWFGGRFNLRLGVCLHHAVGWERLGIDFGVGRRLCLRLASGLSLAEEAGPGGLTMMNGSVLYFERTKHGIKS